MTFISIFLNAVVENIRAAEMRNSFYYCVFALVYFSLAFFQDRFNLMMIKSFWDGTRNHFLCLISFAGHPKVRVFMTHAGLLGSSEAAFCGVPVVSSKP